MGTHDPIAYTYEADTHCPACAESRFGRSARGFIAKDATDDEGNPVGAVFEWDECPDGIVCGTCGGVVRDPWSNDDEDDDEDDE